MSTDRARHVGIDVARCLALLGMVATHVLERREVDGTITLTQSIAGGRSSALFAVLAGVSIALVAGRRVPLRGRERVAASAGLVVRALLIAGVGLALGELESGIAIILTYYGVLFLLALPFLGMGARSLLALAAAWAVVVPVASHLLRPSLPVRSYDNPTWERLVDAPVDLGWELLLTGYYPAVPWVAYLLLGLAVGRLDLGSRASAVRIAVGGAVVVGASLLVSRMATAMPSVQAALFGDPPPSGVPPEDLLDNLAGGKFGTTPADGAWQWLLVVAPHTATPFDLLHTGGSALVVIGLCLLLVQAVGRIPGRVLALAFGAGTMTLSLYSLHVLMNTPGPWPFGFPWALPAEWRESYRFHAAVLLGTGLVFSALGLRGPMEAVVRGCSRAASWAVSRAGSRLGSSS